MHRFEFGQLFRSKKLQAWAQEVLPLLEAVDLPERPRPAMRGAEEGGGAGALRPAERTFAAEPGRYAGAAPDGWTDAAEYARQARDDGQYGLNDRHTEPAAAELRDRKAQARTAEADAFADGEALRAQSETSAGGGSGLSMEEIDRFFRRDSRRYDSGF